MTEIGKSAFYGTGMTEVKLPAGLTKIGYGVFDGCGRLTDIEIPEGVTDIDTWAFRDCRSLKAINIPAKVKNIEMSAFEGCASFAAITVDKDNTKYDSRDNCNAVIETANDELVVGCDNTVIPESVVRIGKEAFSGRKHLTEITIPDSVKSIGRLAFQYTEITIPSKVRSIESTAFGRCVNLYVISLPSGITSIAENAFNEYGTKLTITWKQTTYNGLVSFKQAFYQ